MDRRSILAFVLIFVVFIVWSKVYVSRYGGAADADSTAVAVVQPQVAIPEGAPPAGAAADFAETTPAPATVAPAASGAQADADAPLAFIAPDEPSVPVTIRTDLFEMVVDPRGARVVSWIGRTYPGPDGQPLQLVPQGEDAAPVAVGDVLVYEQGVVDLAGAVFQAQAPSRIDVDPAGGERRIVFAARTVGGLEVRKIFVIDPERFLFRTDYEVSGDAGLGRPVAARFVWDGGLAETEKADKGMAMGRGTGFRAFAMVGDETFTRNRRDLDGDLEKAGGSFRGSIRAAGVQSKYFMIAGVVPEIGAEVVEGRIELGGDAGSHQQSWRLELPLRAGSIGSGAVASLDWYFGPNDYHRLRAQGLGLQRMVNLGWKWLQPISELVLRLMNWLHGFIPNYGWIVVIISVLSKLVFYPLTARGTRSMRKMQQAQARLKPRLDAAKQKYASDPQRYNQEMMKIYKEEGVNPMAGMGGCMPMLVQMPVFLALYQVLYNMVDLRMTPFILWIKDLSQPDALFQLPFSLPLLGADFNLLPILMALVTYMQTKLTPTAGAPGQMASFNTLMPVMMLFFLYNMPSGLIIYWTINTGMTAYQTWMIHRSAPAAEGA